MKKSDGSSGEEIFPLQLPEHVLEYLITKCRIQIDDALVERYWRHLTRVGDTLAVSSKQFREGLEKPVWALGLYGDEACMGLINAPQKPDLGDLHVHCPFSTYSNPFVALASFQH